MERSRKRKSKKSKTQTAFSSKIVCVGYLFCFDHFGIESILEPRHNGGTEKKNDKTKTHTNILHCYRIKTNPRVLVSFTLFFFLVVSS